MKPFVVIAHAVGNWRPEEVEGKGLTGAEEVVTYLSEALARIGYRVAVCVGGNPPDRISKGVRWTSPEYLAEHWKNDPSGANTAYVSSFYPFVPPAIFRARKRIFWPHSIGFDDVKPETWKGFDLVVCATRWQASAMVERYGIAPPPSFMVAPYGINPPERLPKVPGKCLYASSPDRGLLQLLRWWPKVRALRPGATLYVAYGRERMRERAKHDEAVAKKLAEIDSLIGQDGVVDLGFLTKSEMYRHLGDSKVWTHPSFGFEETGCLVGQKALAAGCVPVYGDVGCLPEVMRGGGYCYRHLNQEGEGGAFVAQMNHALADSPIEGVSFPTWTEVAAQWANLLGD